MLSNTQTGTEAPAYYHFVPLFLNVMPGDADGQLEADGDQAPEDRREQGVDGFRREPGMAARLPVPHVSPVGWGNDDAPVPGGGSQQNAVGLERLVAESKMLAVPFQRADGHIATGNRRSAASNSSQVRKA